MHIIQVKQGASVHFVKTRTRAWKLSKRAGDWDSAQDFAQILSAVTRENLL